jgi:predicted amidophosphoribosyltransferase
MTAARCPGCTDLTGFGRARSVVVYQAPASSLTIALKRRGRSGQSVVTGRIMADLAATHVLRGDVVAWVPAGRRAYDKGFDHAELLARAVARRRGCPFTRAVIRVRDGRRQADAPRSERRGNVQGLFASRPVRGDVLLVDDVFTTGATSEACALALLEAGADHVDVVTFARTVRRVSPS